MGGHGGSLGYKKRMFSASVPTTKLEWSEKQVAWATDIRSGMAKAIQAYYDAALVEYGEKAKAGGKKGAISQKKLDELRPKAEMMNKALANVKSAEWFIDNRSWSIESLPTTQELVSNEHNVRKSFIAVGNTLLNRLKKDGYAG